jgi:hypothetical protein
MLGYIRNKRLDINVLERFDCEICNTLKHVRTPFDKGPGVNRVLSVVSSKLAGPMAVRAKNGAKYFQVTLDKYSNFHIVNLLPTKAGDTVGQNVINAIECLERESA